jgi:hypothetical protein
VYGVGCGCQSGHGWPFAVIPCFMFAVRRRRRALRVRHQRADEPVARRTHM